MSIKRFSVLILFCMSLVPVMAQTSGATAPEVTSFEPVDTTDLVNLVSGDFTYSIPAVTIPGAPGGAYPVSLNYHSGIAYGQESSWVGLGWNLFPGSISHQIRGIPDDYNGVYQSEHSIENSTYSYSVGLEVSPFGASVQWDNHGGYGGTVSASLKAQAFWAGFYGQGEVGIKASWYKGRGWSKITGFASVSVGYGYGPMSVNAGGYADTAGNREANAGLSLGHGGFSVGIGRQYSNNSGTKTNYSFGYKDFSYSYASDGSQSFSGLGATITSSQVNNPNVDIKTTGFSIAGNGFTKTTVTTHSYSQAFGFIHLPDVRSNDHTDTSSVDQISYSEEELDTVSAFKAAIPNGTEYVKALDFHLQSKFSKYLDYKDKKNSWVSDFISTYVTPAYDGYLVSAQGISGNARPINKMRGWIKPSGAVMSNLIEDDPNETWRFHPYRQLFEYIRREKDLTGNDPMANAWDGDYRNLLKAANQGWIMPDKWDQFLPLSDEINMVFVGDNGYHKDENWLVDPSNPSVASYNGMDYLDDNGNIQNVSKRIRYHLDSSGHIDFITVVKEDGLLYIFGKYSVGDEVYGAAPTKGPEFSFVRQDERLDQSKYISKTTKRDSGESAYSWHLAAIQSPDYIDTANNGYTPDDYGLYIYFKYTTITEDYEWMLPWSTKADSDYLLSGMGFDTDGDTVYTFERQVGKKSIAVPLLGVTKTHVAYFEPGLRFDNQSAETDIFNDEELGLGQDSTCFAQGSRIPGSPILEPGGITGFYVPFPIVRFNHLSVNDHIEVDAVYGGMVAPNLSTEPTPYCTATPTSHTATYVGLDPETGMAKFDLDGSVPVKMNSTGVPNTVPFLGFTWDPITLTDGGGVACLKSIQLYDREEFEALSGFGSGGFMCLDEDASHLDNQYLTKIEFDYSYDLERAVPNSKPVSGINPYGGLLTLDSIHFFARGRVSGNNGYHFDYYNDPSIKYGKYYQKDPWGYYSSESNRAQYLVDLKSLFADGVYFPTQANWSLKQIKTPVGTELTIKYDADQYAYVQDLIAVDLNLNRMDELAHNNEDQFLSYVDGIHNSIEDPNSDPSQASLRQHLLDLTWPLNNLSGYDKTIVYFELRDSQRANPNSKILFQLPVEVVIDNIATNSYRLTNTNSLEMLVTELSRLYSSWPSDPRIYMYGVKGNRSEHGTGDLLATGSGLLTCGGGESDTYQCAKTNVEALRFELDGNPWPHHVVIAAEFKDPDDHMHIQRFVCPIMLDSVVSGTSTYRIRKHHVVDSFLRWLVHLGSDHVFKIYKEPIPLKIGKDYPARKGIDLAENGLAVLQGGGIRVSEVALSGGVTDENYAIRYYYTDPATWDVDSSTGFKIPGTGFESGVIFVDPPFAVSGFSGGDRRIVKSEDHPYLNMLGAEIYHQYVTVQTVPSDGVDDPSLGLTTHEFITPRDHRVTKPFTPINQTTGLEVESYSSVEKLDVNKNPEPGDVFLKDENNHVVAHERDDYATYKPDSGSPNLPTVPGESDWWESSTDHHIQIGLVQEVRERILNNTSLVGQTVKIINWDKDHSSKLSQQAFDYNANYHPFPASPVDELKLGERPLLMTYGRAPNGKIQEIPYPQKNNSGVFTQQSNAILLKRVPDTNSPRQFHGKILMIDEIFNNFRQVKVTSEVFEPLTGTSQRAITENVAFDYYTGNPIMTRTQTYGTDGITETAFGLKIPAHELYRGMRDLNMISQTGYELSATQNSGATHLLSPKTLLEDLDSLPADTLAHVVDASLSHWTQPYRLDGSTLVPLDGSWVEDAKYSFIHETPDKTSNGWRYVNLTSTAYNNLLLIRQPDRSGHWQAQGQNTLYDSELNVIEYHDLQNVFSSAKYIDHNQLVAANFSNAQATQVYYEGFEDRESGGNVYVNIDFRDGHANKNLDYMQNFSRVYVGTHSWSGTFEDLPVLGATGLHDAYDGVSNDNREHYWLSFYCTGNVTLQNLTTVDGVGLAIDVNQPVQTADRQISPVDGNWYHVHIKVSAMAANARIIPSSGKYLDEITIYPAADDTKTDGAVSIFGYHPLNKQVISITDARGRTARFEYDERGQLFRTYDTKGRVKTEYYKSHVGERLDGGLIEP